MSAYIIGQITIKDRKGYRPYAEQFMPILKKYNGVLLGFDDKVEVLEGEWTKRIVLASFASKQDALAWYHSPEYSELIKIRQSVAESNIILLNGLPPESA